MTIPTHDIKSIPLQDYPFQRYKKIKSVECDGQLSEVSGITVIAATALRMAAALALGASNFCVYSE
jgi:hypothetical protein